MYNVGDRVKNIVSGNLGTIYRKDDTPVPYMVNWDSGNVSWIRAEFVRLEEAAPVYENYKIGDKVQRIDSGTRGTILISDGSTVPYRIQWENGSTSWCTKPEVKRIENLSQSNTMEKQIKLTLEQAQAMYKATPDQTFKDLLLANFTREELERISRPSFEQLKEFSGFYISRDSDITAVENVFSSDENRNVVTEEKYAKAWLAFCELTQVHKNWIGDWKPLDQQTYYSFTRAFSMGKISIERDQFLIAPNDRLFNFPTLEMRNEFAEKFKTIIEEAKYFIH